MPSRLTTVAVASAIGISALSASFVAVPALAATVQGEDPGDALSKRVSAIRDRLQGLVDDKTLTDAQADKVAETLGEKGGPFDHHGPGLRGGHFFRVDAGLEAAAGVLGMSEDDVREALRDGKSLKDLATEKGKSVDDVVAAITKAVNADIDQAVKAGKLTQAQADEAKQRVADGVKRFVENGMPKAPEFGKGFGRGFGGGHGPWGRDGDGAQPEPPTAPTPAPSASTSGTTFLNT